MAESLIQKYLDAGLFDIGEEDERLGHFQKAADDLAKIFAEAPKKLIPAILTAIDPSVPESEPLLIEAEAAVRTHWKAFSNKYPQRPVALLRPVLLEALAQRSREDVTTSIIIWLVGGNLFEHVEQTVETAIVRAFLAGCGEKTETEAERVWAPSPSSPEFVAPKLAFKLTAPKAVSVDKPVFQQQLQQHANHYGGITPNAAPVIADAINATVEPLYQHAGALIDQLKTPLKDFGQEFGKTLTGWINSVVGAFGAKTNLLWWKQSLYSPALQRGYRGLGAPATAIVLAIDLNDICSTHVAPQSVEYLLRETVRDCLEEGETFSLEDLLRDANTNTVIRPALTAADLPSNPSRICLLHGLQAASHTLPETNTIRTYFGISGDFKLPASEWAVWLFRNAQALDLSQALVKK